MATNFRIKLFHSFLVISLTIKQVFCVKKDKKLQLSHDFVKKLMNFAIIDKELSYKFVLSYKN